MTSTRTARIVSLQLCVGHREPMQFVDQANIITGFGIEGDRHGTSDGVRTARQILLIEEETLQGFGLSYGEVRENVTTAGIDLSSLDIGENVKLGHEVLLRITGLCEPCSRMDEIRSGLRTELNNKRGMLAYVVHGGIIRTGDIIKVMNT